MNQGQWRAQIPSRRFAGGPKYRLALAPLDNEVGATRVCDDTPLPCYSSLHPASPLSPSHLSSNLPPPSSPTPAHPRSPPTHRPLILDNDSTRWTKRAWRSSPHYRRNAENMPRGVTIPPKQGAVWMAPTAVRPPRRRRGRACTTTQQQRRRSSGWPVNPLRLVSQRWALEAV